MLVKKYFAMGDQAIVAQFEEKVSVEINQQVHAFLKVIEAAEIKGITLLFPSYTNLTIIYDPFLIKYHNLLEKLKDLEGSVETNEGLRPKTFYLPVAFGGKHGQDVAEIAELKGKTEAEVIEQIQAKSYYIYMIGFIAGYPYCGNIDEDLRLDRRENPRLKVRRGTVQIADKQIGIVTTESPSGWHQVGWTPTAVFDPNHHPPGLLEAGSYVRFIPISPEKAENWTASNQKAWDEQWATS